MFTKFLVSSSLLVLFASLNLFAVQSPDGFAVWSNGTGYDRTLYKLDLAKDKKPDMEKAQKITNKGPKGGDIMSVISYDGKWVAFSRDVRGAKDQYGPNDYHHEEAFDLFIVRIDGELPNNDVIRIDEGTWPSWGREGGGKNKDVSGDFGPPYTLYWSQINGGTKQCTISKDGEVSDIKKHSSVSGRFKMVSPNGKYIAYYPGHIKIKNLETGKEVDGNSFSCHPSFASDSYWVLYARDWASNINGKKITTGIGQYHYGTSNDMEWAISRRKNKNNDQNTAHEIGVWKMNATENDIKFEFQFDVGMGNFPDIHVFTKNTPVGTAKEKPDFKFIVDDRGIQFTGNIEDIHTLEIIDTKGGILYTVPITSKTIAWNNTSLSSGLYFLRLRGKHATINRMIAITDD